MILVIHGTNRIESQTKSITDFVTDYIQTDYNELDCRLIDLTKIPIEAFDSQSMYHAERMSATIQDLKKDFIDPASKIIFIVPEYNGSIPGILKLFIDACSISDAIKSFYHKKVCLIGVATGRAGNLRGMDHLTGILLYLNMIVFPNRLPISRLSSLINEEGKLLTDPMSKQVISKLLDDFIKF